MISSESITYHNYILMVKLTRSLGEFKYLYGLKDEYLKIIIV